MSVINTMLKDLEQRQAAAGHGRYQPPRRAPWWPYLLLTLGMMGAAGGGVWWWLDRQAMVTDAGNTPAQRAATDASKTVAPAAATPAAPQPLAAPMPITASAGSMTSAAPQPETSSAVAAVVPPTPRAVLTDSAVSAAEADTVTINATPSTLGSDEALLGPDEGPQVTEASLLAEGVSAQEPQGELHIEEQHLTAEQTAALERSKGMQAMARGDLALAREAFERALASTPRDREVRERLASLLYGEGRLAEARQLVQEGTRLDPGYADFRLLQARLALAMGDKPGALQVLSVLDPVVGPNQDYYATRAALAQELAQFDLATRSYQQLTLVQPNEGRWWLGLAISLDKQGRTMAAQDAYQRASGLNLSQASRQFVLQRLQQLES